MTKRILALGLLIFLTATEANSKYQLLGHFVTVHTSMKSHRDIAIEGHGDGLQGRIPLVPHRFNIA